MSELNLTRSHSTFEINLTRSHTCPSQFLAALFPKDYFLEKGVQDLCDMKTSSSRGRTTVDYEQSPLGVTAAAATCVSVVV